MVDPSERERIYRRIIEEPHKIANIVGFTKLTELHGEWIRGWLLNKKDETLQAHRDGYKSVALAVMLALRPLIYPDQTAILMRKTEMDVKITLGRVADMLSHELFRYFASKIYDKPLRLLKNNASEVHTNLMESARGEPQLSGLGINNSLTGKHAELIVTDDICSKKDRYSAAERQNTINVYYELENICSRASGGKFINTGTPWHPKDVFTVMPKPKVYTCYDTGLMTEDQIAAKKAILPFSLFAANYELRHVAAEGLLFDTERPKTSDDNMIANGKAHIDAGYGGDDCCAFTIAKKGRAMGKDGRVYEAIYVLGKLRQKHIDNCVDEFISYQRFYRAGAIYTESNSDKGYLAKDIRKRGGRAETPYHESQNKHAKISTVLKGAWESIIWHEDTDLEYISQVMEYSEDAPNDDAADSLASLILRLTKTKSVTIGDVYPNWF
jgi:hypothetical protein